MKENLNVKTRNNNISLTAYRAIKILKLLMKTPADNNEIMEVLKQDEITNRSTSDDTLRISINSLKAAGCEIKRPCPKTNFRYVLVNHPFKAKFTPNEVNILTQIRKYFLDCGDWRTAIEINQLYDKIIAPLCDEQTLDLLNAKRPFVKVRREVLKTFYEKDITKKEILMTYATSSKKIEKINIASRQIFCEAGKLYIMGWYYKRNSYSYFNAEKIVEFHSIERLKEPLKESIIKVLYKVKGDEIATFICNSDEKIIKHNNYGITVECNTTSEFKIIQRLLSFGADFELISPIFLKQKLIDKISEIKARYN